MHDPCTVAFEIKYPWGKRGLWPADYREAFITIWHRDPETDGTDDSCGWFPRARDGDQAMLSRIVRRFEQDWDRTWTDDPGEEAGHGKPVTYHCGLFKPNGDPRLSPAAIVVNLFTMAAHEMMGFDGGRAWVRRNLFDVILLAENPSDSLFDSTTQKFGFQPRSERITEFASLIYAFILRRNRPWYRHPRWHIRHWEIHVHPWLKLRRWLLSRCCKCGRRFTWNESPYSTSWDTPPLRFLRGERHLYHGDCLRPGQNGAVQATDWTGEAQ